ncbi:MAG TPA: carboxypeptidase regulatory-like domain-containing protein [Vicinamibacterales bacterium]|nr:carboxypeptidase regulatory-like domain-containing protein [Vicinamibacterales bacterium]
MRGRLLIPGAILLAMTGVEAQRAPAQAGPDLPVRRVILYKSGVGFFEHFGSVTGNTPVTIQFTSAQLNDVLQSLTALDLDGGSIASISYNSVAPIEQRLATLRTRIGGEADRLELLQALRGARVIVRSGAAETAGRIFSAEQRTRARNGVLEPVTDLTLIGDEGAIRTVELTPASTVQLAERDVREDISAYLGITASTRGEDARRMVMSATGTGTRRIAISYISEVPIWKSTYRLVLPEAGARPMLQGWAIVDNTLAQDWTGVELSLVAGAPQSFVQQISQPYYVQRPMVPLPPAVLLQPQTHAGTLVGGEGRVAGTLRDPGRGVLPGARVELLDASGSAVASAVTDASGGFDLGAAPGVYTLTAQLAGFQPARRTVTLTAGGRQRTDVTMGVGGVSESVTISSATPLARSAGGRGGAAGGVAGGLPARSADMPVPAPPPPAIDYMAAAAPAAQGQELGELFEYRLQQPVTIRRNESALVPILQAEVDAERVSMWTKGAGSGRPLRGVWLTNSSTLTLDGGSFSVIDANAFAGEGLIESLKPGERRLISYGADLAVLVKAEPQPGTGRVLKIVAQNGLLVASQEQRVTWKYTARNEDASARTLIIEHPVRPGWAMAGEPAPAELSPNAARYRLALPPKQEAALTLTERQGGDTTYRLSEVDDRTIAILAGSGANDAALRRALQPLIDKRAEMAAVDRRISTINAQLAEIERDQQRVRENMKALRGSSEEKALIQRYTKQLADQEDRLSALRGDLAKATAEREARLRELSELAGKLQFELPG